MNDTAHSYHPKSGSLEDKVEALRIAISDLHNAQNSLDSLPNDRLGSVEEVEYALSVSQNTFNTAIKALSKDDLKQAQVDGLISSHELIEVQTLARQTEMASQRANQSGTKDSLSHKQ